MNPGENTPPAASSEPTVGDPLRAPMPVTAEGGTGFDTVEAVETSTLPRGVAVLILVALVGGGSIMGMRQFGLGSGYAYDDIKIDYPIDAQVVSNDEEYDGILDDLTNHNVPHVAINELRDSPFELAGTTPVEEMHTAAHAETPEEREARLRMLREQQIQLEFYKLTLNSVIGGSSPIARVAGQPVRPGDRINDLFLVKEITGRSVVLEAEGKTYTLTMSGQ